MSIMPDHLPTSTPPSDIRLPAGDWERVLKAARKSRSHNTKIVYRTYLTAWAAHAEKRGVEAGPAHPAAVAEWLTTLADEGKSVSTLQVARAAIAATHREAGLEDPPSTELVRRVLSGLAREAAREGLSSPPGGLQLTWFTWQVWAASLEHSERSGVPYTGDTTNSGRGGKGSLPFNPESENRPRLPPMASPRQGVASRETKAAELPPLLVHEFDKRGGWVALAQFAQDWNRHPDSRQFMMRDPLPAETDPKRGAAIAAVVHSLCIRDGVPVPDWVLAWRNDPPVTLASGVGMESSFGRSVRVRSPAVCEYHGVFFEVSFRDHG